MTSNEDISTQGGNPSSIGATDFSPTPSPERSWWEENNDWILPVGSGILSLINPALGSIAMGASTAYLSSEEKKYQQELLDWQQEQQYLAEKRANTEYDRRTDKANKYNENWAQRLLQQGINPLMQVTKGQSGAMASSLPSSPSVSSMPRSNFAPQSIGEMASLANAMADVRLKDAQAKNIETQSDKAFEEGKSQFLQNCITKFMYGEAPTIETDTALFEIRYGANVDDDGNITFTNLGEVSRYKEKTIRLTCSLYKYLSDKYGDFVISEGSYNVRRAREELVGLVGDNYQIAEDLAQSWSGMYSTLVSALASGKQADAAMVTAMAKDLEANYHFGDEFNAKWWVDTALRLVQTGANVVDSIAQLKGEIYKAKPKTTKTERHTYTSKTGTDTYQTVTSE